MGTRFYQVLLKVEVNGSDVTDQVTEVRVRLGFDLRVSEADVDLTALGAGPSHWDTVEIWAGIHGMDSGDTASDGGGAGQGLKRFSGYLFDFDYSNYPARITLQCRGPLILAERVKVDQDAEAITVALPDPLLVPSKYDPPGIDLSTNPDTLAPWTDADMVTWVLQQCGLGGRLGTIGGTGHILGSTAVDQFIWRRDQSGLSFIQDLEKVCLGFRTFETLGGTIVRANTSPRAPFEYTSYTLAEASDAGFDDEPASVTRNADEIRNRAVVSGYDNGGGAKVAVVVSGATILPPGVSSDTIDLSSGMIEKSFTADIGVGLACDEVGAWLLDERVDPTLDVTIPTWRDEPYAPGQVTYANLPHSEVNQSMWTRRVDIKVNATSFTQVLALHDRAQRDRGGTLGSSGLPSDLG